MSSRAQVTLLRFLQDHEYRPLGAKLSSTANVRVIAASNADLERLVEQGVYRMDLLYRLSVLNLRVPPLRERSGDPCLLAEEFLRRLSLQYGRPPKRLHPDTVADFDRFHWPGNVRQLENAVERAVAFSAGRTQIDLQDLPSELLHTDPAPIAAAVVLPEEGVDLGALVANIERELIQLSLERTGGNKGQAARLLHLKRTTLVEKLKRFDKSPSHP
jgi:transcriptional regulator with PAS, ATPase and Fis domain